MSRLHLIAPAACLAAFSLLALASCAGEAKEDENASIVNVEKGVASPVRAPEGEAAPEMASQEMPAPTAEETVQEQVEAPAETDVPAETEQAEE